MRTTLNLDDGLVMQAKILAIRRRTTLSRLIEDALREAVESLKHEDSEDVDLPVSSGPPLPADFPWHSGTLMIEYLEASDAAP